MMALPNSLRADAERIWQAAIGAVDPQALLAVAPAELLGPLPAGRIVVVGAGKAAAGMAAGVEGLLAAAGGPEGIVTDRDIVIEVSALDLDPNVLTVGDIALPQLVTACEGDGLQAAADLMRRECVRRLPVLSEAGELVGILSFDDLLVALMRQLAETTDTLGRGREINPVVR